MNSKIGLESKIDALRSAMVATGMSKGFTDPETIRLSQELDLLIHEAMVNEKRKQEEGKYVYNR
jgi:hypothetical protein